MNQATAESPAVQRRRGAAEWPPGWLDGVIRSHDIVCVGRGTPSQPGCPGSARIIACLRAAGGSAGGRSFAWVDGAADPEVLKCLAGYSGEPSVPQLYVDGALVGGVDLVETWVAEGRLGPILGGTAPWSASRR